MLLNLFVVQIAQFGSGLQPPSDAYSKDSAVANGQAALNNMTQMISNVIGIATVLAAILFIIYFLMAAYAWITSEGDSGKLQKARNQMIHAIIGLVVLVSAYAIIGLVGSVVGIDILNPAEVLRELVPQST
jgi:magnesium-transporting ATPase (P-type)